jgi:hypothetical protein
VRRFQLLYLGRSEAELEPKLFERGHAALALMEGLREGIRRDQRGIAGEIADDRVRLGEAAPVLQHEGRHAPVRVEGEEIGGARLTLQDVELAPASVAVRARDGAG